MTLIELLVVVSIMMLLVLIAVPRMRPGLEERRIREAARSVNVYLSSARSRAIENQRPWGVAILRDANSPLSGVSLIQVEVPVPYAGDDINTSLQLSWNGTVDAQGIATVTATRMSGSISGGLIRLGDQVQINAQGRIYTITAANGLDAGYVRASPPSGSDPDGFPLTLQTYLGRDGSGNPMTTLPWPAGGSGPVTFQILRQPVPSSVAPLQLPRNTVLDLWYSGTASTPFSNTTTTSTSTPITTILFNSTGAVDQVAAHNLGGSIRALEPIYLMVGRRDRVNPDVTDTVTYTEQGVAIPQPRPVAEDGRTNLADLTNLWVAVNPQTGYVTCAEMANGLTTDDHGNEFFYLPLSRQFAREFQSMGGR